MTRSQIVLRVVVFAGPVLALLATSPAGNASPWWVLVGVLALAGAAAWQPDGIYLAIADLAVLAWWAVSLGDDVPVSVVAAAVALVASHLAAVLASYGPPTMPVDAAVVRLWVRRGALVLLTVPAAWGLARALNGEPEQPGIWLLGVAAAFVATVVATAALTVRPTEREA